MKTEEMQARLQQVDKALEEMKANYNVLLGTRNELVYWIQQATEKAQEKIEEAVISE